MSHTIGVLLAAGMGTRLMDVTTDLPKALVKVGDLPLVLHAVNFLKMVGVDEIKVIGGFCYDQLEPVVKQYDSSIEVIENKNYTKGNLYTLDTILPQIQGSFLVMNIDHIYAKEIASRVKAQMSLGITAFTDYDRVLTDDDMKVETDTENQFVQKISKSLTKFNRGYVGITYCHESYLVNYKQMVEKVKEEYGEKAVVENVLQKLSDNQVPVKVGDISGYSWLEVDFKEELARARAEVKNHPDRFC